MNHFRWSGNRHKRRNSASSIGMESESQDYNQPKKQQQTVPELYISSPLNGVPGTLNAVAAHVAALSHGMADSSTPICPSVYSHELSLSSGFTATSEERALAIQARAVGTLVFLSNPYYGSTRCLKELQQCKANLSAAMILDAGLGVAEKTFDRSIYPFCDGDSQKFAFWSRRAEQANSFMGGMEKLHCSNLSFSKFTCDRCFDNSNSVCTSCSDFNQHMNNPSFLSSVRALAGVINQLAPTLIQSAVSASLDTMIEPIEYRTEGPLGVTTPTASGVTDYSNQSSVHSPSDADKKRLSATARNPIFDDVDDIDMATYAQLQQQHNQQQASSNHRNSLTHKLKAGFNSFMHKTGAHSTSHNNEPLVQRDSGNNNMFFSSSPVTAYDDDEVAKEIGEISALLMEDDDEEEPVVFMYSSEEEGVTRHPDAIAMLPKQQRLKGVIYVVDGVRKKWDGRQWRRLCTIASGCSAASRGTTPFCVAHGRVPECKQADCKNLPMANSRRCEVHGRKSSKSKKKESTTSSTSSSTWPSPIDGRCQFKTALGDLCGNSIADARTAPLCTPCWCCVTGYEWKNDTAAITDVVGAAMASMTLSL